jgi:hypothetical protein
MREASHSFLVLGDFNVLRPHFLPEDRGDRAETILGNYYIKSIELVDMRSSMRLYRLASASTPERRGGARIVWRSLGLPTGRPPARSGGPHKRWGQAFKEWFLDAGRSARRIFMALQVKSSPFGKGA